MPLKGTDETSFPIISHVDPIWPREKRNEKMETRKSSYWQLVRKKMIVMRFLRSIHPEMTVDFFLDETDKEQSGSNISALKRNFLEEQRKKYERLREIQMEAYRRRENQKTVWEKFREHECANEWRRARESKIQNRKRDSGYLTCEYRRILDANRATTKLSSSHLLDVQFLENTKQDTKQNNDRRQSKHKARSFIDLKEEYCFKGQTCLPEIHHKKSEDVQRLASNDPRFQRLLHSLIPPEDKGEKYSRASSSKSCKKAGTAKREPVLTARPKTKTVSKRKETKS